MKTPLIRISTYTPVAVEDLKATNPEHNETFHRTLWNACKAYEMEISEAVEKAKATHLQKYLDLNLLYSHTWK